MKYQHLLSEVKKFLKDTRIIEWCSQCKGACCGGIKCQSLNDCNNRVLCKIHICSPLLKYLFCGKDSNDYEKMIDYIIKRMGIKSKRRKEVSGTARYIEWNYPYNKEMDEIEFDDAKLKFIFKINREKISEKMKFLLLNDGNFQCSKTIMDEQCMQCTKLTLCSFYLLKKERQKELAGQKSLFTLLR